MRLTSPTAAISFALLVAGSASAAHAQDPRAARLAAANTFPSGELAEREARVLTWLDTAGRRFDGDQAQGARESIYYLIGSVAQAQLAKTGALFPARDTMGLAALYDRAATLGEPGAALVASALRAPGEASKERVMTGGTLKLAFRAPEYVMTSSRGWSIRFPFYMMIGAAQLGMPNNGVSTETVVLSTLFATDPSPTGRSQATIMINAAAASDSARFVEFWLRAFGVGEADRVRDGETNGMPAGAPIWRQYDHAMRMHKELVVVRRGEVIMLFAYAGLPGTFQANREEFLAVLRSLSSP